ncbi:Uncharacterized conserved protein YdeI, YjbR/CyaY-like superfamily, DUF1801 family [Robiginitalea myxolifaciens]|uniref:Uncharacterized conserved protein YdeI, YjbR/CyaY-like superfamily, DUF1801 family n=1 Tax=Robiginitalea myxolifaciens TaxID=400055 RepID=A0A1I6HC68_9FLAO|nr:YdeI/OmpD-associated family protein [Robiginitalea myxolifaciens]SFR51978.1 Uncharacterized conserved protein YdeI, YjbR/CyaY-like superfamily, DUF1801 family [Robiginitalea myxolifaciens]
MIKTESFEQVEITSIHEIRDWLSRNYTQEQSVWLVTYKKNTPEKYVSRWDVLDELLCFGWIDGIRRKLDDTRTMQLISPRKVEHWAKTYKERAARLIEAGKMHESGLASIQKSKAAGLWNFMDDVDNLIIPEDLKDALSKEEGALSFFSALNDSSLRFALRWLKLSKTDTTRQNRIKKLVLLSSQGKKLPGS